MRNHNPWRICLTLILLTLPAMAQATPCGVTPTPGAPHVCLTWIASTTTGVTYNAYRASATGKENYATPLNATPIPATQLFFYDTTVTVGTDNFYTVTAVFGGALSAPTPEVSVQVPLPPNSPTTLGASVD
jgi:hypothetical protein